MIYKVCYKNADTLFDEVEFEDRHELRKHIEDNLNNYQRFSLAETGHIFVYAAELDENGKPARFLYLHEIDGFIWLKVE